MSGLRALIHRACHAAARSLPHALTHLLTCADFCCHNNPKNWILTIQRMTGMSMHMAVRLLLIMSPVVLQAPVGRACRDPSEQWGAFNGTAAWPSQGVALLPLAVSCCEWSLVGAVPLDLLALGVLPVSKQQ